MAIQHFNKNNLVVLCNLTVGFVTFVVVPFNALLFVVFLVSPNSPASVFFLDLEKVKLIGIFCIFQDLCPLNNIPHAL